MKRIHSMIILPLIITAFAKQPLFPFDVNILPEKPVGGEALLIKINTGSKHIFTITFDGKTYTPFKEDKNTREIYLPMDMMESGKKDIIINEKISGKHTESKILPLVIEKRKIKTHYFKEYADIQAGQPLRDKQRELVLKRINTISKRKLWKEGFVLPVDFKGESNFAVRRVSNESETFHKGVDMSAKLGATVKASNSGKIILTARNFNAFGNAIIIDHGQGIVSCYFHLKKFLKKKGSYVNRNDVIAEAGSTGWSTSPHLHFAVYIQGKPIDPLWWLDFTSRQ